MKVNKICCVLMSLIIMFVNCLSSQAGDVKNDDYKQPVLVSIDGVDYDAAAFMDRVIQCTEKSVMAEEVYNQCNKGDLLHAVYNENGQRVVVDAGKRKRILSYDDYNRIVAEETDDIGKINYLYDDKSSLKGFEYAGITYYYIYENDLIIGFSDSFGNEKCRYEYDVNGKTLYSIEKNNEIEQNYNFYDNELSLGYINSMRFDGSFYLNEVGLFLREGYSYYNPESNDLLSPIMNLNRDRLFGNQPLYANRTTQVLINEAALQYQNCLGRDNNNATASNWYTYYANSGYMHYLCARIIYGENTQRFPTGDSRAHLNSYLKMNRQAEAWVIVNRILEDELRIANNRQVLFSTIGTTNPTVYTILTKFGTDGNPDFGAINGEAKGLMDASNIAYQEAFWLACCIKVGRNFDEWSRLIPRYSQITYQCYNKGHLDDRNPDDDWKIAYIPGWDTDYDYQSDFEAFPYENELQYFNVIHALYSDGTLRIQNVYY